MPTEGLTAMPESRVFVGIQKGAVIGALNGGLTPLPHHASQTPAVAAAALTRRELQILQLIAEGDENADIARELFLSIETVRTHVKSILRKLSARDRTHAVTLAYRSGLLAASIGSSS